MRLAWLTISLWIWCESAMFCRLCGLSVSKKRGSTPSRASGFLPVRGLWIWLLAPVGYRFLWGFGAVSDWIFGVASLFESDLICSFDSGK